jgi:hypothetical protein
MNLRVLAGRDQPYHAFNREERHLAAILFHLLSLPGNVERLFALAKCYWQIKENEFGVYFEYSYLRDLWHAIGRRRADANAPKRAAILSILGRQGFSPTLCDDLAGRTTRAFNTLFIGEKGASAEFIQSPANWRLAEFVRTLLEDGDIVAACKVKWAFKAKPDLVIHADRDHVLCLELKLESGEGTYPASANEKKLLRERGLFSEGRTRRFSIRQRDIQKFALEGLLGFEYLPLFVTQDQDDGAGVVSWQRLFDSLAWDSVPPFMAAAIARASRRAKENHDATEPRRASATSEHAMDGIWLPGLPLERIIADYAAAPGKELESKLLSPESSAALVANAFGFFLERPSDLPPLPSAEDWGWPPSSVRLEAIMRFPWAGGRHPCLDVLIETPAALIGIESKRYEPFRPARAPTLSDAYWRPVWGPAMSGYERVRDGLRDGSMVFTQLDAGQLVKHAFGLRTEVHRDAALPGKRPVLLYLYAEPPRWHDGRGISQEDFASHRAEIARFAQIVNGDEVAFRSWSYRDLLVVWSAVANSDVRGHAAAIAARFPL